MAHGARNMKPQGPARGRLPSRMQPREVQCKHIFNRPQKAVCTKWGPYAVMAIPSPPRGAKRVPSGLRGNTPHDILSGLVQASGPFPVCPHTHSLDSVQGVLTALSSES